MKSQQPSSFDRGPRSDIAMQPHRTLSRRWAWVRLAFGGWYVIGLMLMLTVGVPAPLSFANGVFLVLFAAYAASLEAQASIANNNSRQTESSGSTWSTSNGTSWPWQAGRFGIAGLLAFSVEWLGVTTGFPFGEYTYSTVLGFALGGVPLAISLAWIGVVVVAVLLSSPVEDTSIASGGSRRLMAYTHHARGVLAGRGSRAVLVGVWAVLFDLVLDPVAYARGFWLWAPDGTYYGVPLTNFWGWFVFSGALSLLFPLKRVSIGIKKEAARLLQAMVLLFGLLALQHGMFVPVIVAIVVIGMAERTWRQGRSSSVWRDVLFREKRKDA